MEEIPILILRMIRCVKFQTREFQNIFDHMLLLQQKIHEKIPSRPRDILFISVTFSKHTFTHTLNNNDFFKFFSFMEVG